MKKQLILLFSLFGLVACNSCAPQPQPAPPPAPEPPPPVVVVDAGPTPPPLMDAAPPGPAPVVDASVRDACANITLIGCAEGGPSCPGVMQKALSVTAVPLPCLVGAHTKSDVRACGSFVPCR